MFVGTNIAKMVQIFHVRDREVPIYVVKKSKYQKQFLEHPIMFACTSKKQ